MVSRMKRRSSSARWGSGREWVGTAEAVGLGVEHRGQGKRSGYCVKYFVVQSVRIPGGHPPTAGKIARRTCAI